MIRHNEHIKAQGGRLQGWPLSNLSRLAPSSCAYPTAITVALFGLSVREEDPI